MNKTSKIMLCIFFAVLCVFSGYYIGSAMTDSDILIYVKDAENGKIDGTDIDTKKYFSSLLNEAPQSDTAASVQADNNKTQPQNEPSDFVTIEPAKNTQSTAAPIKESTAADNKAVTQNPKADKVSSESRTTSTEKSTQEPQTAASKQEGESTSNGKININIAGEEELDTLSGIGQTLAKRIIEYREQNGAFSSIDEITQVRGIGEATYNKIKDFICT